MRNPFRSISPEEVRARLLRQAQIALLEAENDLDGAKARVQILRERVARLTPRGGNPVKDKTNV